MNNIKKYIVGIGAVMIAALGVAPAMAADPQRGGVLTAAVEITPNSLDPIFGNSTFYDRAVYAQLYENLLYQDDKGKLSPSLAESWTVAPDGKSVTFKLRDGVVFHDGTPFNAEAVKFNIDRVTNPETKAFARFFVAAITSTEIVDPMTVRVNFDGAPGVVLAGLVGPAGMMVSPTAQKASPADFGRNPVGTGPFQFVRWVQGDRVEVKRFDKYWMRDEKGQPLPYLDGIVTRLITNSTVKLLELRSGNVQLSDVVQEKDYGEVQRDASLELLQNPVGISQYLAFPAEKPPFNNIVLRQAVSYAINRAALSKVVTGGTGTLVATFESPNAAAFDPSLKPHEFNLDKAKEYYKQSGHKGPMNLIIGNRDIDIKIAQILQSQLKAAGMTVTIEVLERQAFFDRGINQRYDLMLQRTAMPVPDPDMLYSSAYGKNASVNYAGIKDELIAKDVDAARAAKDPAERKRLYAEIQKTLLDNYYQTFFFWRPNQGVKSKKLTGVDLDFMGAWRLGRASFVGTPPR